MTIHGAIASDTYLSLSSNKERGKKLSTVTHVCVYCRVMRYLRKVIVLHICETHCSVSYHGAVYQYTAHIIPPLDDEYRRIVILKFNNIK